MKKLSLLLLWIATFLFSAAQLKVENGLIENRSNPLGLDIPIPRFSWQLISDKENTNQQAFEIKVLQGKKLIWGTGKVISDQSVLVDYAGPKLSSHSSYQWQVRVWDTFGRVSDWSSMYYFHTAFFMPEDWKAKWIGFGSEELMPKRAVQYYRTDITIAKKVAKATAYITSQGMYEAQLNGKRIGDAYLTPGWTSYKTRLQYQVYDVSGMLNTGKNAIGAMLGNGWFRGTLGWTNNTNIYGDQLALLFQLHVEYADGSKDIFVSDEKWKTSYGAIRSSEIYDGEEIDARLHNKGWSEVGFDDSKWDVARVLNQGYKHLIATYNEPVRKHETFSNPKYLVTPKGEKVLDFGQNLVGWVKVIATGKTGDSIIIKHAEVLDKAGNFYTENMRAAKTTAKYILSGNGNEEFEPHFTFYGFRYIKVEGIDGDLDPSKFTAITLYSDMEPTGKFTTSNPLINQLQHNIQWGQRGNFLDVPTDCPQRDERLGWTGDAQAFSRTATFNFRTHSFFAKWLRDLEADQLPTGGVPHVIPNVLGKTAAGSAGWADVATIIPWDMYLVYGDKRILETQFNSMKNWVRFMEENSKDDLWNVGFHFGDWLFYRPFDDNDGRAAVTDKYLIAQCFYAHSTQLLIRAAEVLGKKEELEYHQKRLTKIKEAFVREYVTPSGRLVSGTQTAYVLALNFDMLPEHLRMSTADRLVENIRSYGNHLSTGFLGTPYLCEVLTRFGKTEMAFKLLMQETFPSWLYPVKMGATTIWERWSGIRPDGSFEPAGMNSFNHYAYGAIGDWMYRRVAGIDNAPGSVGYKKLKIEPNIGGGLTQASAIYKTYYGEIESAWNVDGKRLNIRIRIPANTTATIHIPSLQNISINGKPLDQVEGLSKSIQGERTLVELGSGSYAISADML